MSDKKSLNEAILDAMESEIEMSNNQSYNDALEWAASWITGAQLLGRSEEIQEYARNMAMSIRAAKRGLTSRAPDVGYCTCPQSVPWFDIGDGPKCNWCKRPRR